ncbi:META domain-containing protein [Agromyces sp. LHK192]|uniref:META domain-containing protein n=1 Tax=Agromyces sp. LHK192 TaxID=2498704 RepID=UPI00196B192C|nr:META domain-containing protein [Agromyces sp. LHK192]
MRGIRSLAVAALAVTAVLGFAACAGASQTSTPSTSFPAGPTGDPITEADVAGVWGDAADPGAPSLTLAADGTLSGTDGCNRLVGEWELDDGEIDFGDLASTKMACQEVDTWLSGADSATITEDVMTVYANGRIEIGTLERTGDAPAAGADATSGGDPVGSWGTADTAQPHLVLAADGTFSGSDGCNAMTGRWEMDDDGSIEFDDVAMTAKACSGIDQTLNRLDSATVSGDTMTVLGDDDVVLATLPRTA